MGLSISKFTNADTRAYDAVRALDYQVRELQKKRDNQTRSKQKDKSTLKIKHLIDKQVMRIGTMKNQTYLRDIYQSSNQGRVETAVNNRLAELNKS